MKVSRPRITYANVVATLALFIALGGVSWAAVTLPKNSVGSKQIKKNAVTSAKIKKNSITGAKVKNNSLTGSDINASTLAKVPNAGRADSAATSDQIVTASKRVNASFSGGVSMDDARSNATEVPLVGNGQVSIYGKCYVYSGTLFGEIIAKSTADGALASTETYSYYAMNGYLNPSTPEAQRYISLAGAGNNSAYGPSNDYAVGQLYGPDGNALDFTSQTWVKRGNVPTYGNGPFGAGDVCIFMARGAKISPS